MLSQNHISNLERTDPTKRLHIYTDGACRKQVGGWAWWCENTGESKSGTEDPSTNQRMELYAALDALNEHFNYPHITIFSDSAYLVNCFGEKWWIKWLENGWVGSKHKGISNRDIWEPLLELVRKHGDVRFIWVKGHNGNAGNELADGLATAEVVQRQKEKDEAGA